MSLINDALRRAKQVQEQAPAPPPPPPLSPVDHAPTMLHGLGILVPVVMTAVALLGLFLLWQIYQRNNSSQTAQSVAAQPARTPVDAGLQANVTPTTKSAAPTGTANVAGANVGAPGSRTAVASPNPDSNVPAAAGIGITSNAVPTSPEGLGTNTAVAAPPEPPKPAPLTLQGIVFNPRRPSVVINGRTLFVGDRIGQFRVTAIHPDSTVLVGAGRTNLLSLDQ